jgi:lipoprotein-anchoring transpeptidase ErfK/SrfK
MYMNRIIKSLLILSVGVFSGFGFYHGAVDINNKYTGEFFIYVGGELSFGYEIVSEQLNPTITKAKGGLIAASEFVTKDRSVVEVDNSVVIRDNFTKYQIPSRIRDRLTIQTVVIPSEGKSAVVDLDAMTIHLYDNGIEARSMPIKSKGRPGSAWETPAGEYEIQYKAESHFSSIGEVYMPYSMQFFGNFFIHGWPYDENGDPVGEGYSGGCIRIEDGYIEEVYNFVDVGTKLIIVGGDELVKQGEYIDRGIGLSKITSDAYLVADLLSGEVIIENNSQEVYPIASLSKLMTALVSLEATNQFINTKISRRAVGTYGYQGGLEKGEDINVGELLYPLLLESSNDAAEAIAEVNNRNHFMKLMNQKAKSIGLFNTSFDDPSGLSAHNISTAEDLFRLVQYIHNYKRYILDLTMIPFRDHDNHTWYSNSRFIKDDRYIGSKNGYTDEARKTLIVSYNLDFYGVDRPIAIVLLHGSDSTADVKTILNYISRNIEYLDVDVAS